MRARAILATAAIVATAAALLVPGPATARPIEKGHETFDFVDDPYDCDGLVMAQDSGTVRVNFLFNQRGSSAFPYYKENVHGTAVHTNLTTGGTMTEVFRNNFQDHTITDNGDGTITITVYAKGGLRIYDQFGNFVRHDPGQVRYAFDIDYNGTPGDPSDDVDVEDSFRIVRESTGRNDTQGREFCEDLLEFTS